MALVNPPATLIVGPSHSAKQLLEILRCHLGQADARLSNVRTINVEHGAFGILFDSVHFTHDADPQLIRAVSERGCVMAARLKKNVPVTHHYDAAITDEWLRSATPTMELGPAPRPRDKQKRRLGVVGWVRRGRRLCGV